MGGFDLPPVTGFDKFYRGAPLGGERLGGDGPAPTSGLGSDPLTALGDAIGKAGDVGEQGPFGKALADSLGALRKMQNDVNSKYEGLITGEDVELHDVMVAANKSEVTFNLMLEVRNKLVEAWEKLSRSAV